MAVQTSEAIEGAPADQRRPAVRGHALALVTVVVWAVTFVSTKVLLVHLAPIEILFFRFVIGFVALALLRPRTSGASRRSGGSCWRALPA